MNTQDHHCLLRPADQQDAPFLYELFCEARRDDFIPLALPAAALEPLLAMQFRARTTGYAAQFPAAKTWVITHDGHAAGQLILDHTGERIHLVDLAVSRTVQRRGCATHILEDLIAQARNSGLPLRLSVRFDNPALRLYEKLGFLRTGGDGLNVAMEVGPAAAREPRASEPVTPEDAAEPEDGSSQWYRRFIHQQMAARTDDGTDVPLTLVSVTPLLAEDSLIDIGDSFSLDFRGPLTPLLPSAIVTLTAATGRRVSLFLSPTGPREAAMHYEAVFNRMQHRSRSIG